MKKVIITLFFVVLVMVGGCGNVEKQKLPPTQQDRSIMPKEKLLYEISYNGMSLEKQIKLKELMSHSSYIIGSVLSHNYFSDVGDQELWQNARRNELRIDYVKFHNLFDREMSTSKDFNRNLWQIDESYLQAITAMKMKKLDNGFQTDKEGVKESFNELFTIFLTEKSFKMHSNYSDAEDRFERFKKYAANDFEYEKGLFE
ncbi:MAG: hypothetical protein FH756_01110 [Firmicutes bacterium]|nr:hypothetical protein [Bacillota bacterium]